MKVSTSDWKVHQAGFSSLSDRNNWTDGVVFTPNGIVAVYAQGDAENFHHTRLDFVWRGLCYSRDYSGKRYSHRGIKTIARKFAAEIVSLKGQP